MWHNTWSAATKLSSDYQPVTQQNLPHRRKKDQRGKKRPDMLPQAAQKMARIKKADRQEGRFTSISRSVFHLWQEGEIQISTGLLIKDQCPACKDSKLTSVKHFGF